MSYTMIENVTITLPDIPAESIVSRKTFSSDHIKVTLFGFAPGEELTEHTAAYPAILHFLSGEASLTLEGNEFTAVPGTWVHMPAHLPHSLAAKTAVTMLLYLITA